ncbi:glycosyltransferase family 8 protein, partial [Streptococcus pneumoniae]
MIKIEIGGFESFLQVLSIYFLREELFIKMKKSIVFNADNNYIDKLETVIKSICCHNDCLKFYVFNDDISSEWFLMMNKRLKTIQSEIVNVKIVDHVLKKFHLPLKNLSYATFFRYFIPNFVKESRALYLDSDIIVTENLDYLFDIDLEGYPLAAIEDSFGDAPSNNFNAGVLLVDVDSWRDEDACTKLLELTNQYHETAYGDQGILNMLFHNRWKKLDRTFNFMVGMDSVAHIEGNQRWYEISEFKKGDLPSVIHYTGVKPWEMIANNRFREVWWFYNLLEWSDILLRKDIINRSFEELVYS